MRTNTIKTVVATLAGVTVTRECAQFMRAGGSVRGYVFGLRFRLAAAIAPRVNNWDIQMMDAAAATTYAGSNRHAMASGA